MNEVMYQKAEELKLMQKQRNLQEAEYRRKEKERQWQEAERQRQRLEDELRYEPMPKWDKEDYMSEAQFYQSHFESLTTNWSKCGVGQRHDKPCRHDCAEWTKVFDSLRGKLGKGFLYLLVGIRGTGKTQLASELCRVAIERALSCGRGGAKYARVMQLFVAIRNSFKSESSWYGEDFVYDSYIEPNLLVFDDIHDRTGTVFENNSLNHFVDGRYRQNKDTLLIGNLEEADIEKALGPSIISRANEAGGIIKASWPSFRI